MWLIFLMACVVVALAAMGVIFIGHKLIQSMEDDEKLSDFRRAKKMIKEMNKEDEE